MENDISFSGQVKTVSAVLNVSDNEPQAERLMEDYGFHAASRSGCCFCCWGNLAGGSVGQLCITDTGGLEEKRFPLVPSLRGP